MADFETLIDTLGRAYIGDELSPAQANEALKTVQLMAWEIDALQQARLALESALRQLAADTKTPLEPPHDPQQWHGNLPENIAMCPTCYVNAALLAADASRNLDD